MRVLIALAVAFALNVGAMLRYPGGTTLDHSGTGYSLAYNFLSDLGMTVAYNGQTNVLGAILFALSLFVLIAALGSGLFRLVQRYVNMSRSRRWAYAASSFAFLACTAFAAVAVTPENLVMPLHIDATFLAWRVSACAALLLFVASALADTGRRKMTIAWGALALSLAAYVWLLQFGPELNTLDGLRVQVVAQKVITVVVVSMLCWLSNKVPRARQVA